MLFLLTFYDIESVEDFIGDIPVNPVWVRKKIRCRPVELDLNYIFYTLYLSILSSSLSCFLHGQIQMVKSAFFMTISVGSILSTSDSCNLRLSFTVSFSKCQPCQLEITLLTNFAKGIERFDQNLHKFVNTVLTEILTLSIIGLDTPQNTSTLLSK